MTTPSPSAAVPETREQRIEALMKQLRPKIEQTLRQMVERAVDVPEAQEFGTIDFEFRDAGQKLANEDTVASVICQRWQSLGRFLVATVPPRRLKSPK